MNIGYIYGFNSYPPQSGGAVHVYNLVRSLTRQGHRVHTVGEENNPDCTVHDSSVDGWQTFAEATDVVCARLDGSRFRCADLMRFLVERSPRTPITWEINAAADEARARPAGIPSRRINWARFRRSVGDLLRRARVRREERIRHRLSNNVTAAVCVSEAMKRYARERLRITRAEVIPNGSDPDLFRPDVPPLPALRQYDEYFKVMYCGDSRWPWQAFDLVMALARNAERRHEKTMFIAVDNSPSAGVSECANLLWINRVTYRDVPAWLAGADVCLCLYHNLPWQTYGFHLSPLKLFDYMAVGKPIIASAVGQIASILTDGQGGLLTSNDLREITAKLDFLRTNREAAARMGRRGRELVVKFYNWDRVARQTADVFASLSAGNVNV